MRTHFISFAFILITTLAQAQKEKQVQFLLLYDAAPLELGQNVSNTVDVLTLDTFKMYISNVTFYLDDKKVGKTKEDYLLLDAENPESLIATYKAKRKGYNKITFNVGIDSITNHKGVGANALDPSNGLYWTWQNGYINMKLEGTATDVPTRNNKFQYHIGGYQYPSNTLQEVTLKVTQADTLIIPIDIASFLNTITISEQHTLMRPNAEAVLLANKIPLMFLVNEK